MVQELKLPKKIAAINNNSAPSVSNKAMCRRVVKTRQRSRKKPVKTYILYTSSCSPSTKIRTRTIKGSKRTDIKVFLY